MSHPHALSPAHTRWLRRGAWLLAAAVALGAALLAAGLTDPRPAGARAQRLASATLPLPVGAAPPAWQPAPLPAPPYTLQLHTRFAAPPADVAYGLLLGTPADHLGVHLSPLGYVHVWRQQGEDTAEILPFQPWPHVRPADNEIWLTHDGRQLTLRINRELLWQGDPPDDARQIALSGRSFAETAVVTTNLTLRTSEKEIGD